MGRWSEALDLAILLALARILEHPAAALLESPYVHYVANQPRRAQEHFYGVREATPGLVGMAIYDRLEQAPPVDPNLIQRMWKRREIENYLCLRTVLDKYAWVEGEKQLGELFSDAWRETMSETIDEIEQALKALGKPAPWSPDIKASDDFLDPLFKRFFEKLQWPNLMMKTDYHKLAEHISAAEIPDEVTEMLDLVVDVAGRANARGVGS